tara:strand:+ start:111 stop:6728 length:6618 start_codon:yes stop_codon:yes gene_type:complete
MCGGNYFIEFISESGCVTTRQFIVREPDSLQVTASLTDILCSGESNGVIDISVSGGVGDAISNATGNVINTLDYNYYWNGPNGFTSNDEDITDLTSGNYAVEVIDNNGCISQKSFTIEDTDTFYSHHNIIACDSYNWNGVTYTESGVYTFNTVNSSGCDSVATLNLTINNSSSFFEDVIACDSYNWLGNTFTESGTYTYALQTTSGCDSLGTLNVTINNSSSSYEEVIACDSFIWNGVTYNESGVHILESINEFGCTDTSKLNLTINNSSYSSEHVTACDSFYWNGEIYNESGTYEYLSQESDNNYSMSFDGINDNVNFGVIDLNTNNMNISFDVFVHENSFNHGVEIIGQNGFLGEDWFGIRHDESYNQNNHFSFRRYKEGSAYDVVIPFEMEAEVWTNISVNYSLDNQFVHLYVNGEFVGSDDCSLEPLSYSNLEIGGNVADENSSFEGKIDNLTIWNTTLSEIEINNLKDCGTNVDADNLVAYWNFDEEDENIISNLTGNENHGIISGATYSSNIPEQFCQLTTANGCNSVSVLNLTITQPDTSIIEVTACESYEWNGEVYTQSGTYYYHFSNSSVQQLLNNGFTPSDLLYSGVIVDSLYGKVYQDGIIYHIDSVSIFLASLKEDEFQAEFGCNGTFINNTSTNLGTGLSNSQSIIQQCASNNIAANLCLSLITDYHSDWFMPSRDELQLMYSNLKTNGYGDFDENTIYWSSSNGFGTPYRAWIVNFSDGSLGNYDSKNEILNVRPTRLHPISQSSSYQSPVNNVSCDSVAVLNLTITQPDTSIIEVTACESYEWNGQVYNESGTYTSVSSENFSIKCNGVDEYVDLGDICNLSGFPITIQLDFQIPIDANDSETFILFDTDENIGNYTGIWSYVSLNTFACHYGGGNGAIGSSNRRTKWKDMSFNAGQWYNLALTIRGPTDMSLYVDGVDIEGDYDGYGGSIAYSNNKFVLGKYFENRTSGKIDNIAFWHDELTISEIQSYMNCSPTGNEEDLVGYWNFEEGQGNIVNDLSGNGNNGTINGAVYSAGTSQQSCQLTSSNDCDSVSVLNLTIIQPDTSFIEVTACESYEWNDEVYTESGTYEYSVLESSNNYSLTFDGDDDYINCGNSNSLALAYDNITLACWVNTNSPDVTQSLIMKGTTYSEGKRYALGIQGVDGGDFPNGGIYANIDDNLNEVKLNYNFPLSAFVWTHIAFVFDRTNNISSLYVNGDLVDTSTTIITGSINTSSDLILGGHSQNLENSLLNGIMDDILIFNRALSQEEIQIYMSSPNQENEQGLVGHWNFEEGEGNTVNDISGNGNHGTINGATYSADTPQQSYLTTLNGCDSIVILNLNIEICGCVDPIANNFDSTANIDDGSCTYCTFEADIISQNPTTQTFCDGYYAVTPNGQSPYSYYLNGQAEQQYNAAVCNGIYDLQIIDANNCQFDSTLVMSNYVGCKDPEALNYDATALFDNGSCIDVVLGCMDELADNYDSNANVDDENCVYYGCTDVSADNYDETANIGDESCVYCDVYITGLVNNPNTSLDCNGLIILSINSSHEPVNITWDNEMNSGFLNGLCSGDYNYIATDAQGCELSGNVTVTGTVEGCTDPTACNYQPIADIDDESCVYLDDINIVLNSNESGHTILTWDALENVSIYKAYKGTSLDNMSFIGSSFEPYFLDATINSNSYYYQISSTIECTGVTNEVFSNPVLYNYSSEFSVDIVLNEPSCLCCNDGSLSYTISGGFPPYSLGGTENHDSLVSGQYFIMYVSDELGHFFLENIDINYQEETNGCTDLLAVNFDECATIDDGSCEYENLSACDITPSGLFVNDIIHERVRFNWSAPVSAPSYYMIRYKPVGTNEWTVMRAGPETANPFNGTSRTRYFMEPGTTYQWNIRARNIDENGVTICQSPWSASHEFTTLDACPNLVNHLVITEANWVDFYADDPVSTIDVYDSKAKLRELGTNSYRYVTGNGDGIDFRKGNFSPSTDYQWHTKAWCVGNTDNEGNPDPQYHSGWGEFYEFSTEDLCDKMPTNLYTTTNNNQNLITMNWDTPQSGAADHYFLELTNETTGQVFQWNNISGSATSKTKYNQIPGHTFSWRIRGACGENGTSWATPFTGYEYYTLGGDRLRNDSQSNSQLTNIKVYPNPSRGEFNISFDLERRQDVNLSITNNLGEVIFTDELKEHKGQYNKTIDLGNKANGIYMLNITTNNRNINQKIVIQ